jgi:4-aminobutyrate--pyruvate transaminase
VGEVRGVGLLAGVELVRNKATKEAFDPTLGVGAMAGRIAQEHGVLCRPVGDTFPFCPPLIINEAQIGDMLTRFARVLDEVHAWTKSQGVLAA